MHFRPYLCTDYPFFHLAPSVSHFFFCSVSLADLNFSLDGFFDAGMLLSALKQKETEDPNEDQRDVIRRNIGRRLQLAEY